MPAGTAPCCPVPAQRAQLPRACHQRPVKACSALGPPGRTATLRQKAKAPTAWAGGHSSQVTTGLGEWRGIRRAQKYGSLLLRPGCWARAILPQSCQHPAPLRERPRAEGKVPHPFSQGPLTWRSLVTEAEDTHRQCLTQDGDVLTFPLVLWAFVCDGGCSAGLRAGAPAISQLAGSRTILCLKDRVLRFCLMDERAGRVRERTFGVFTVFVTLHL